MPTCGVPVGEGQKRTRVSAGVLSSGPWYSVMLSPLTVCSGMDGRWCGARAAWSRHAVTREPMPSTSTSTSLPSRNTLTPAGSAGQDDVAGQ